MFKQKKKKVNDLNNKKMWIENRVMIIQLECDGGFQTVLREHDPPASTPC